MNAGREMDALVAEKVMGWQPDAERLIWTTPDGAQTNVFHIPTYSDDIAAAWQIIEKFGDFEVYQTGIDHGASLGGTQYSWAGEATGGISAPHAICLAALKAMGIEV